MAVSAKYFMCVCFRTLVSGNLSRRTIKITTRILVCHLPRAFLATNIGTPYPKYGDFLHIFRFSLLVVSPGYIPWSPLSLGGRGLPLPALIRAGFISQIPDEACDSVGPDRPLPHTAFVLPPGARCAGEALYCHVV